MMTNRYMTSNDNISNEVLRENIEQVVKEHLAKDKLCPICGNFILKNWTEDSTYVCPTCNVTFDFEDDLVKISDNKSYVDTTQREVEYFINHIYNYLLRFPPI